VTRQLWPFLRTAVDRIQCAVLVRSTVVPAWRPRLWPIVRLMAAYALAAAGLLFLLPIIAGFAVYAASGRTGRRGPLRAIR